VLVGPETIRALRAARHDERVVVIDADLVGRPVDGIRAAVLVAALGLDLAALRGDDLGGRAGARHGVERRLELALLDAVRGEERDALVRQLSHGSPPSFVSP
jgi:hypothetical protein